MSQMWDIGLPLKVKGRQMNWNTGAGDIISIQLDPECLHFMALRWCVHAFPWYG